MLRASPSLRRLCSDGLREGVTINNRRFSEGGRSPRRRIAEAMVCIYRFAKS